MSIPIVLKSIILWFVSHLGKFVQRFGCVTVRNVLHQSAEGFVSFSQSSSFTSYTLQQTIFCIALLVCQHTTKFEIKNRCFGCGSWNADVIASHPFDRGAFGFRRIQAGVINKVCGIWPLYGDIVARQRCPCNGPLWAGGRGWWCDEWLCDVCFCTYRYFGLADGDEVSFASSIALQAYFEGRQITKADMDKCIEYWRNNISQSHDPVGRKRDVMCEPYCIPCCHGTYFYKFFCNCDRKIPYKDHKERTKELKAVSLSCCVFCCCYLSSYFLHV